jgi:hypothetical protein
MIPDVNSTTKILEARNQVKMKGPIPMEQGLYVCTVALTVIRR